VLSTVASAAMHMAAANAYVGNIRGGGGWKSSHSAATTTTSASTTSSLSSSSSSLPLSSSSSSLSTDNRPIIISNGLRNLGNTCYMNAQLQSAFHIPAVRSIVLSTHSDDDDADAAAADTRIDSVDDSKDDGDETAPTSFSGDDYDDDDDDETTSKTTVNEPKSNSPTPAALALKELFEGMVSAASSSSSFVGATSSSAPPSSSSPLGIVVYTPSNFVRKLGIPPEVQQDSQEFWKLLLPAIGSEQLSDLYKGVYEDYIVALDGSGHERRTDEMFLDLSVDVTGSENLIDSLMTSFGKPELLSVKDGNGWRPVKGGDKVDAHKGSSLVATALPPILQFHLKRFNYDWETGKITKLNKQFIFPQSLDLDSVCSNTKNNEEGESSSSNSSKDPFVQYDLQSVIVHVGEFEVGHYYSYVRPDVQTNKWYRFNDDIVEEVSFDDVQKDAFGGKVDNRMLSRIASTSSISDTSTTKSVPKKKGWSRLFSKLLMRNKESYGWGGKTSNAYILQYVRRSDIPMLYETQQ
jgi:ubiquitin carboxyl-terminal hydrolase 7